MELIDAVKLEIECDGDQDCKDCPLNKDIKWPVFDGGLDLVGPICSWIQWLERNLEDEEE